MSITEGLRKKVEPLWEKMVTHSFVRELGDGTLPWDKFQVYLQQDHLFLRDWVTLLCLAITKAPDFDAARKLSDFMNLALGGEEAMFQDAFSEMGLSPQDIRDLEPLPTTLAYSGYLRTVAYQGSFQEVITALLCIEWAYLDWAKRLAATGKSPANRYYREWINIHAGVELDDFVAWLRQTLDGATITDLKRLEQIFLDSLRYEYLFWEMAYRGERWPE